MRPKVSQTTPPKILLPANPLTLNPRLQSYSMKNSPTSFPLAPPSVCENSSPVWRPRTCFPSRRCFRRKGLPQGSTSGPALACPAYPCCGRCCCRSRGPVGSQAGQGIVSRADVLFVPRQPNGFCLLACELTGLKEKRRM